MGHCCSKPSRPQSRPPSAGATTTTSMPQKSTPEPQSTESVSIGSSPFPSPMLPSPSPARNTPGRKFKWPLPPPSPAKPIMAMMRRKKGRKEEGIKEEGEEDVLDKSFGYSKNLGAKFEVGKEVGRGHFGHVCLAKGKKGELKGVPVAIKIISKAKMTSAIAVEDVRREVKILQALSGHKHTVKFHNAFEDANNVYVVMELCEGGELLDRILSRGGRYSEEDAKSIVVQMLSVVSFCHLQGVVHRDLKPENFLFKTKDEDAPMKVIDFGLSDFVRPDQRLNDVVGSAYYVAPEVLHRSYSLEADMWSIGVITYILLCGSRPFWARTESGIFRSVLRAHPNFDDGPWPSVSPEAKDFVKRLLNKDYRKRMTAVQALTHPWLQDQQITIPVDILMYKSVKSYLSATPFKRAALKALSKAIPEAQMFYLRAQFQLLEPKDGFVTLNNFKVALTKHVTDATKEARVLDILNMMEPLSYNKMGFEEFCAAAISPHQLEAVEGWETIATTAFEFFEQEGNKVISVNELALELHLGPTYHPLIHDWIRLSDGKLNFVGYAKLLHGVTIRSSHTRHRQQS